MSEMGIPAQPKVLVVGNGAREHAIAWALSQSPYQPLLFAAPGNPGMEEIATCVPIPADDVTALVEWAATNGMDLVAVGPEVPLSNGIADCCIERGIRVFGPVQAAARVESSKAFAKSLMKACGVPTASYETFADAEVAKQYVQAVGTPIVIKADGLAAGKGVIVAETTDEAIAAIDDMMVECRFGASGGQIVIESKLEGPELSLMFFVDKSTVVPLLPARDHKRAFHHDKAPTQAAWALLHPFPMRCHRILLRSSSRPLCVHCCAA